MSKPKAAVFDLDGVLACNLHRLDHLRKPEPDWVAYYSTLSEDPICESGQLERLKNLMEAGVAIIILTNRPMLFEKATEEWLKKQSVPYDILVCRPHHIPSDDAKRVALKLIMERFDVVYAVDDDPLNCKMYEEEGIKAEYCESGYYDFQRIDDPTA